MGFVAFLVSALAEAKDLTAHLGSLSLNLLHISLYSVQRLVVVSNLLILAADFFFQAGSLVGFLIEGAFAPLEFINQVAANLGLFGNEELELFQGAAGVGNLVTATVETEAGLVLTSSFVVGEHPVAVFHVKDLVIDTTVVSGLTSEVVELLTQL
jgi:hypothetical protein